MTARTYTMLVTVTGDFGISKFQVERLIENHLEDSTSAGNVAVTVLRGDQVDGGYMSAVEAIEAKQLHFALRS